MPLPPQVSDDGIWKLLLLEGMRDEQCRVGLSLLVCARLQVCERDGNVLLVSLLYHQLHC